jgi:hypothetical protein
MFYIKIVLTLYMLLLICNVLQSRNLVMNNNLYNTAILIILCLISLNDIHIALLLTVCIILNTKNTHVENLFQQYNPSDIKNILSTIDTDFSVNSSDSKPESVKKNTTITTDNTPNHNESKNNKEVPKKEKATEKPKTDCDKMFIISPDMLTKAQDNIISSGKNSYINIVPDQDVRIQGNKASVSGFNI